MDSSRSGPLSTLILMLPLIVVPALVVMRPSEQDSGFSSLDLAAGIDEAFAGDHGDPVAEFEPEHTTEPNASPRRSAEVDLLERPLEEYWSDPPSTDAPSAPETADRTEAESTSENRQRQTPDLSRWGVVQSIWFSPGGSDQVGFAAFVPYRNGRVRYRFSAIGATDREVVEDVIRQIQEWQAPQAAGAKPREN